MCLRALLVLRLRLLTWRFACSLQTPLKQKLEEEEEAYRKAVAAGPAIAPGQQADLEMRIRLVHGDELIADTETDGGLAGACAKYTEWIRKTWP